MPKFLFRPIAATARIHTSHTPYTFTKYTFSPFSTFRLGGALRDKRRPVKVARVVEKKKAPKSKNEKNVSKALERVTTTAHSDREAIAAKSTKRQRSQQDAGLHKQREGKRMNHATEDTDDEMKAVMDLFQNMGGDMNLLNRMAQGEEMDDTALEAEIEKMVNGKSEAEISQAMKMIGVPTTDDDTFGSEMESMTQLGGMMKKLEGIQTDNMDNDTAEMGEDSMLNDEEAILLSNEMENFNRARAGLDPAEGSFASFLGGDINDIPPEEKDPFVPGLKHLKVMQERMREFGMGDHIKMPVSDELLDGMIKVGEEARTRMKQSEKMEKKARKEAERKRKMEKMEFEFEPLRDGVESSSASGTDSATEQGMEAPNDEVSDMAQMYVMEKLAKMDPAMRKGFYNEIRDHYNMSDEDIAYMESRLFDYEPTHQDHDDEATIKRIEEQLLSEVEKKKKKAEQEKKKKGASRESGTGSKKKKNAKRK